MARKLAQEGVASVILMFPLYGVRRPPHQTLHIVTTVSEFAVACIAASLEAVALHRWACETFPGVRCVMTGVSMGGSCATTSWRRTDRSAVYHVAPRW